MNIREMNHDVHQISKVLVGLQLCGCVWGGNKGGCGRIQRQDGHFASRLEGGNTADS
jgi:hypothetical protein